MKSSRTSKQQLNGTCAHASVQSCRATFQSPPAPRIQPTATSPSQAQGGGWPVTLALRPAPRSLQRPPPSRHLRKPRTLQTNDCAGFQPEKATSATSYRLSHERSRDAQSHGEAASPRDPPKAKPPHADRRRLPAQEPLQGGTSQGEPEGAAQQGPGK